MTVKKKTIAATTVAMALAFTVAGCSSEDEHQPASQFGYSLPKPILTLNAGTSLGVATDAAKVSSRLYPGASLSGPDSQLLPNTDIVTATRAEDDPQRVDYAINPEANYSDGQPVVCEDYVLANSASHHPQEFGADMPLFFQVDRIDCAPGEKNFAVHFKEGFGDRYRELFSAGTVMPAHVVAQNAGVDDIFAALQSEDPALLAEIGRAWQDTFNVKLTNPAEVPTSGPYKVAERGENGQLKLVANPEWSGQKPSADPIFVWPNTADLSKLAEDNQLVVADLDANHTSDAIGPPNWVESTPMSERTDTLRLSGVNQLGSPEARRAFNACVDRARIATDLKSSTHIDVEPVGLRVVAPHHPLAPQLKGTSDAAMVRNVEEARGLLEGQTIRIGYLETTPRFKTIVDSITASCQEAGVNIEPVPLQAEAYGSIGVDYDALLDTRGPRGRNSTENTNEFSRLEALRASEEALQKESMTIPLTTEPRKIAVEKYVHHVSDNGSEDGLSWNMDRWIIRDEPINDQDGADERPQSGKNMS